ncbi:O-methyltransferase [Algoriphagus namhaensis]
MKKYKYVSLIHQFYKELMIAKKEGKSITSPFLFFFTYIDQNRVKIDRMEKKVPWITVSAFNFLINLCKPGINVFEYGAGASTLFFGEKGVNLYSVEHNKTWFNQISKLIDDSDYEHVSITLHEPSVNLEGELVLSNKDVEYTNMNYFDYIHSIDRFNDGFFDLILIDGRVRIACLEKAISKLKVGGYLVFDNANRKEYAGGLEKIKDLLILSDYTVSMFDLNFSQTNIYQI